MRSEFKKMTLTCVIYIVKSLWLLRRISQAISQLTSENRTCTANLSFQCSLSLFSYDLTFTVILLTIY